jgi:HK97 family phage portal protein
MLHAYYCYIRAWNVGILKNGGKREIIALVKQFMNPQKRKELEENIKSKSGANNTGVPLILDGSDIDIKNGDFTPRDFDFLTALDEIRNITASVLNVPSILIGDRTNNKFSNYKEAKRDLYTENIIPFAQQISEYLNNFLSDKLMPNEFIDFDTAHIKALEDDRNKKMESLNNISFLTINEKRAELEYPAIEGGDEILISGIVTPLSEALEPVKPLEEGDNIEDTE